MNKNNKILNFLIFFAVFTASVILVIFTFNKNLNLFSNISQKSDLELFMEKIYEDDEFLSYLDKKKEDGSYYTNDKLNDTDGDGLSDFDEENIFFTSKYLADSDGDGVSDFEELKLGFDPSCPTGSSCDIYNTEIPENVDYSVSEIRTLLNKVVGSDYSEIFNSLTDEQIIILFNNSYIKTQDLFDSMSGSLENLDLEEFLEEDLNEEESVLNSENTINNNVEMFLDAISDLENEQIQEISSMDVLEIRNLFIDSGIFTEDFMKSFTDSEILELLNVL